jgi:hypothetical protein
VPKVELEEKPIQAHKHNDASLAVATHLLAKGNAVPANGLAVVNTGNRLSLSQESTAADLGSFSSNAEGLHLNSTGGLKVNGKSIAHTQLLHPDDVISHDDIVGTLVAISVTNEVVI